MADRSRRAPPLPRAVWTLGFVSLLMDLSSETIHALLPVFLTTTLGASVSLVGLIDGASEATASFAKFGSGVVSDRIGRRKPLILFGYGAAALSKPLFAIATGPAMVFAARFADRLAKGVRGAPRDAMIADVTDAAHRGRAFGLRQALDTAGAFAGPLAAIALMALFSNDIRKVFMVAAVPGVLSALLVAFAVTETARGSLAPTPSSRASLRADLARLDRKFWTLIAVGGALTLARFSESFLILKATSSGLAPGLSPAVLVVMNLAYGLGAYPAGRRSDRTPAWKMLALGAGALVLADLLLATGGVAFALAGATLWGVHMALTQGLIAKLVAASAPKDLRATAFGVWHATAGVSIFAGSAIAGALWEAVDSRATFVAGAAMAAVTAVSAVALLREGRPGPQN
ncbi:MAG: MFS transporter [Parvularculaceae bacterium]|nr:MFS transporter [Parvularculaceae bacterium]